MKEKLSKFIYPVVTLSAFFYLLCSFIYWDLNPKHWSILLRLVYGLLVFVIIIAFEEDEKKPENSSVRIGEKSIAKSLSDLFNEKLDK